MLANATRKRSASLKRVELSKIIHSETIITQKLKVINIASSKQERAPNPNCTPERRTLTAERLNADR
jgi:hypothetical protein